MSLECLGEPTGWVRVLDVAARCTGTTPDQALRMAALGAEVMLVPLLLVAGLLVLVVVRR